MTTIETFHTAQHGGQQSVHQNRPANHRIPGHVMSLCVIIVMPDDKLLMCLMLSADIVHMLSNMYGNVLDNMLSTVKALSTNKVSIQVR